MSLEDKLRRLGMAGASIGKKEKITYEEKLRSIIEMQEFVDDELDSLLSITPEKHRQRIIECRARSQDTADTIRRVINTTDIDILQKEI